MRIVVDISGHGFGHLGQTAPVLAALGRRLPDAEFIVRTALDKNAVQRRLRVAHILEVREMDFGMSMADALTVDIAASCGRYRAFHENWSERIQAEATELKRLAPDLLLANIPYLSLAAAQEADIPTYAFCSLNWADIYNHYCGDAAILDQILAAYAGARAFFRPTPGMDMPSIGRVVDVGPLAQPQANRRAELLSRLCLPEDALLCLVATGGVPLELDTTAWGEEEGVWWLIPDHWPARHANMIHAGKTGLPFCTLFGSVDVLLAKPGYATYVEGALAGHAILSLPRPDWPESTALEAWAAEYARFRTITSEDLVPGVRHLVDSLPAKSAKGALATGAEEIAAFIYDDTGAPSP